MPVVKPLNVISEKWGRKTAQATPDYAAGVKAPRKSWQGATLAAVAAQEAGVQEALANKSFEKGVAKTSDAEWQTNAAGKGAQRYGPGAQASKAKYEKNFGPYKAIIEGVAVPPKGPRGAPGNYQATQLIGDALHQAKLRG